MQFLGGENRWKSSFTRSLVVPIASKPENITTQKIFRLSITMLKMIELVVQRCLLTQMETLPSRVLLKMASM